MSILQNILAALIISGTIWAIQLYRYWNNLYRKFNNKEFRVLLKGTLIPDSKVTCIVKRNIIKFEGKKISANQGSFNGEFIINEFNLK